MVIEAEQIREDGPLPSHVYVDSAGRLTIDTLEGPMHPDYGDYRLIGVQGEAYSCKRDIFEATYDLVSLTETA